MLVLSRRIGESIIIGDNIEVTVLELRRSQVRIGIEAPKNVEIVRDELLDEPLDRDPQDQATATSIR